MYNGFLDRQIKTKRYIEIKKARQASDSSKRTNNLKELSFARTQNWASKIDSNTAMILYKGAIELINPANHQFREYKPGSNICIKKYLLNENSYLPEKERIKLVNNQQSENLPI